MRWIYLSPHLDDAALSAGGLIYEQTKSGIPVEIWTFMCGYPPEGEYSPVAQMIQASWKFSSAAEAVRERRAEDKNAAEILGASTLHFDFLDCIYRRGLNGEWLYSEITVPPHEADAGLPSRIAEAISTRILPGDVLACQLAVGSHVDHVIVRQAVELLGKPLRYDIDVPYIFYKTQELEPKSAGMKESVHSVTETGVKSWQEAVLAYKSQIPTLGPVFDTPDKVRESIQTYWAERNGIRLFEFS
jgi:LmbE family N-acetylglucosaminyl deacetylase